MLRWTPSTSRAIPDRATRISVMDLAAQRADARSLLSAPRGVGGHILRLLQKAGHRPLALSRSQMSATDVDWVCGDLGKPATLTFPAFTTLYCTADAILLAGALPHLNPSLKRVIAFSSTSVLTKLDSEIVAERQMW